MPIGQAKLLILLVIYNDNQIDLQLLMVFIWHKKAGALAGFLGRGNDQLTA